MKRQRQRATGKAKHAKHTVRDGYHPIKSCSARTLPQTCVQVIEPMCETRVCVAQILNRRHVLPCPFGLQGILQASQASSVSQPGQWCWQLGCDQTSSSCGASVTSSLVHLLGSARSTSVSVGLTTDGPWCLRTSCSHTSCSARAAFFCR